MELVLLCVLVVLFLIIANWLDNLGTPDDNREPYVRDEQGRIWALYVSGPVNDVPDHERFIHDGTPHQNPAVHSYMAIRWFFILPFPEEREERWYPITDNGIPVNLDTIQQRISQARLGRGQEVELITMPQWAEKQTIRREHGEQLGRGVPANKLRKKRL